MQKLRNIAIIAHVDHGKTTLVDKMILAGHILRDNAKPAGELILDNNDLERERGITILSKNVSVIYKDYKINIIDTPGHADFGGEVERVLNMCDGVLLLVDAFEGTMPQTRFVLQKALALGKKPIVVINKVDKPNCRPEVVNEQVFDLMFSLDATEEQLDYKTIYGSAKQGWMSHKWNEPTDSIVPLLDAIIDEIPEPKIVGGTPQMLITSLEYSPYTGRIAVGKVTAGNRWNVLAGHATLEGTVRTFLTGTQVEDALRKVAECTAAAFGAKATLSYQYMTEPVINSDEQLNRIAQTAVTKLYGKESLITPAPLMGSEDFSWFGKDGIPYIYGFVASHNKDWGYMYGNHHEKYDVDETILHRGAAVAAQFAADYLAETAQQ